MAPPRQVAASGDAGVAKADCASAERSALAKLRTCQRLAAITGALVDALSGAASSLQHAADAQGAGLLELSEEEAPIRETAKDMVEACTGVAGTLINLAVALSGGVEQPLRRLERAVFSDRERRLRELDELRHRSRACTAAVTDSLRKKDRASAALKAGLAKREAGAGGLFDFRSQAEKEQEADKHLQQLMAAQSEAVEEFDVCQEQAMVMHSCAQVAADSLAGMLCYVDFALRRMLHATLPRCALAWQSASDSLRETALRYRGRAQEDGPTPPSLGAAPCPEWATIAVEGDDAQRTDSAPAGGSADDGSSLPATPHGSELSESIKRLGLEREEIEKLKAAAREAQDLREIQLLEREAQLEGVQRDIESQRSYILEHRKHLALDQARCMAMLERTPGTERSSPESYRLCEGSPDPAAARPDDVAAAAVEDAAPAPRQPPLPPTGAGGDEDCSQMYDMDWSSLPPAIARSLSQVSGQTPQGADDAHGADAEPRRGQEHSQEEEPRRQEVPLQDAAEEPPLEEAASLHDEPAPVQRRQPPPLPTGGERLQDGAPLSRTMSSPGRSTDGESARSRASPRAFVQQAGDRGEELKRKLEVKRLLADEHDGEDLASVAARPDASAGKGRLPGVHPDVAAKLEARLRVIEAAEGLLESAPS